MATNQAGSVLVGVDGSAPSDAALDWAVAEARLRSAPLRLVHASDTAGTGSAPADILAGAEARVRAVAADIDVVAEAVPGHPAAQLVAASTDAALIVIGNRGLGGFRSLLVGSVGVQVAGHAECPVVVVRAHGEAAHATSPGRGVGTVVVGVDGSVESAAAIEFAFQEAKLRGVDVTAVHAWYYSLLSSPSDMIFEVSQVTDVHEVEEELLTNSVRAVADRYPGVTVRPLLVPGTQPTMALVRESTGAELLVVGSRGLGGFAGLLLGSVSHASIHHAACPVAVVRP